MRTPAAPLFADQPVFEAPAQAVRVFALRSIARQARAQRLLADSKNGPGGKAITPLFQLRPNFATQFVFVGALW
jgi:hypothetical protein